MRIFQGLGSAATETASYAIAATLFPDNVTVMLGILEVANGLGYVIGPPLGGVLYNVNPMLPFLVVGLSPIPVLLSLYHLLPKALGDSAEEADWGRLRHCLSRRGVALVCAAAVLGEGSFAFVEPVLEVFLIPLTAASDFVQTRLGGHHGGVGVIYAVVSVLYSAATPLVGLLSRRERLGSRNVMISGLVCIALGFLLLAPSPLLHWALPSASLAGVAFGMAFLGLGQSAALVPNMACLMEVCEDMPEQEATTNVLAGILNAAYSLGSMIAPITSSTLSIRLPFKWTTTLWSAFLACMALALSFCWDAPPPPPTLLSLSKDRRLSGAGSFRDTSQGAAASLRRAWRMLVSLFIARPGEGAAGAGAGAGAGGRNLRVISVRLAMLAMLAGALLVAYYGELMLISDLSHLAGNSRGAATSSSDTEAYYLLAAEVGVKTSSSSEEERLKAVAAAAVAAAGTGGAAAAGKALFKRAQEKLFASANETVGG